MKKYKNIKIVKNMKKANFITHSGRFHVDDVISTVFLRKINKKINLIRLDSVDKDTNLDNKLVYDIGMR